MANDNSNDDFKLDLGFSELQTKELNNSTAQNAETTLNLLSAFDLYQNWKHGLNLNKFKRTLDKAKSIVDTQKYTRKRYNLLTKQYEPIEDETYADKFEKFVDNQNDDTKNYLLNNTLNSELTNNEKDIIKSQLDTEYPDYKPPKDYTQINNGINMAGNVVNTVGDLMDNTMGGSGTLNSTVTRGINSIGTLLESAPGLFGGIAKIVNGTGKIANNTYNKVDEYQGLSAATQVFGSSPLGVLGVNAYDHRKIQDFNIDKNMQAAIGGSYNASFKDLAYNEEMAGKTVSGFDRRKILKRLNNNINKYNILSGIYQDATNRFELGTETAPLNNLIREWDLLGTGVADIRVALKGAKLEPNNLELNIPTWEYQEIPFYDEFNNFEYKEAPAYLPKEYQDIINKVNNSSAHFVTRLKDPNRKLIRDWEHENDVANFKMSYSSGLADGKPIYYVYPEILELDGKLYDFTNPEYKHVWHDAYNQAIKDGNYITFDNENDAKWFTENYKLFYPGFDNTAIKFANGGTFNLIPEGALHARKHNIDIDGITKKGIPVISEMSDGNIQQLAEIEHSEIIYRREVTKMIEELLKEYDNSESEEDKDRIAIEAGKLLVNETLYNTADNTNLIKNV